MFINLILNTEFYYPFVCDMNEYKWKYLLDLHLRFYDVPMQTLISRVNYASLLQLTVLNFDQVHVVVGRRKPDLTPEPQGQGERTFLILAFFFLISPPLPFPIFPSLTN